MRGTVLLSYPPQFTTFELAHRIDDGVHKFEVAYGSSFNELYYDFSPHEFLLSVNRPELELQLKRAGQGWLLKVLEDLASGALTATQQQIAAMVKP